MVKGLFHENPREFPRVNLDVKGIYRVLNQERKEGCAEIQNLSHGGLMFIASHSLNKGVLLDITIYYQELEIPLNAKVVWAEPMSDTLPIEYQCGIEVMKISTIDKIYLSLLIASCQETKK